jgi:internalin A
MMSGMSTQRESGGFREAVKRIEKAGRSNSDSLDLSGLNLTSIPESVAQLVNLTRLDLHGNQIADLPEHIFRLANLEELLLDDNQLARIPQSLVQLGSLSYLSLDHNRVATIPDFLCRCRGLEGLYLQGNRITVIPDSLGQLTSLETLYLYQNQIESIPDSLGQLVNLSDIALFSNLITAIPDSLAQLCGLEDLFVGGNKITTIPDSLGGLANLRSLSLWGNQIAAIPDSLAGLTNLDGLDLSRNQITAIPDSLARLTSLRKLDLSRNQIANIPGSFAQLSALRTLDLSGNQIATVPEFLAQLGNLEELDLGGNPLPAEIFAALGSGVSGFLRYLRSTAAKKVHPRTVKLVLLGEPQSGKTTLVEALKGNPHPCDPSRKETIGVNVVSIEGLHPSDHQPMFLSLWDFAGQHIEHATHQFFLTENAIYLILWNSRQGTESGKRDLWYWLELLKMRVRNPKFLLVATHTEHTPPDLNLSEIERSYPGCQGHFPVELEDLRGYGRTPSPDSGGCSRFTFLARGMASTVAPGSRRGSQSPPEATSHDPICFPGLDEEEWRDRRSPAKGSGRPTA